jgi:tRNA (guanine-N7-)-methyltransferase
MAWENQYMQLVTTKPGIIVAENDREPAENSRKEIQATIANFPECYVELGSGSGMHLIRLAARAPQALCVGLEIRFKRAFKTGEKAEGHELSNIRVLRTDARQIGHLFSPGQVGAFFINYPDPWDKRRWRKNRLITAELIQKMWELLKPGGFLRYKTDHHEYFSSTCALLNPAMWEVQRHTSDLLKSPYVDDNIPTEFEMLFKSQGKPLCLVEAVKRVDTPPDYCANPSISQT